MHVMNPNTQESEAGEYCELEATLGYAVTPGLNPTPIIALKKKTQELSLW